MLNGNRHCLDLALAGAAGFLALTGVLQAAPALAADATFGSVQASVDTTVSQGVSVRIQAQDEGLLADLNGNDGNLNYDRGLISNTSKFTSDLSMESDTVGLFARVTGFIDFENRSGAGDRTGLSDAAKDIVGSDLELLDFYGVWSSYAGDTALDLRLGRHVVNWGESTFIPNGISTVNPVDLSKLRLPGSEIREALLPVNMASASVAPSDNLSLEGFYQFEWEPIQLDPVGTYFSTVDYVGAGADRVFLALPGVNVTDSGLGPHSNLGFEPLVPLINADLVGQQPLAFPDPDFLTVVRNPDRTPGDSGQYGIAARMLVDELNGTEFGAYLVNYHSRLPLVSAQTAPLAAIQQGLGAAQAVSAPGSHTVTAVTQATTQQVQAAVQAGLINPAAAPALIAQTVQETISGIASVLAINRYAGNAGYFLEYPDDQPVLGLSVNTQIGNWAVQGDFSFRPDAPLQRAETSLLAEGLAPIFTALTLAGTDPAALGAFLATYRPTTVVGYVERDVSQLQATLTRVFGPTMGADSLVLVAEAAAIHVHDMPDSAILPLESPAGGASSHAENATALSMGYRIATRLDFNQAIGSVNLFPYGQFLHDFKGNSPAPIGSFAEGQMAVTIGLKADYLTNLVFDIGATFYSGKASELSDRDYIYSSIKYSF